MFVNDTGCVRIRHYIRKRNHCPMKQVSNFATIHHSQFTNYGVAYGRAFHSYCAGLRREAGIRCNP
jgi:hypothetical protein